MFLSVCDTFLTILPTLLFLFATSLSLLPSLPFLLVLVVPQQYSPISPDVPDKPSPFYTVLQQNLHFTLSTLVKVNPFLTN